MLARARKRGTIAVSGPLLLNFESMLFKRVLDIVLALIAILVFMPLMIGSALAVRIQLGSPVLFTQVRPGHYGRPFRMVKFRSMRDAVDAKGLPLPDEQRMTRLGAWLRASSLDELPEVWNVLRGDMSIVGPRPVLMEYLPLYTSGQARRHEVRPGITGWAQINGRNAITWERRFELDVWYVDHQSLKLDLQIIAATFARVVQRDGVAAEGHVTMEPFRGDAAGPAS